MSHRHKRGLTKLGRPVTDRDQNGCFPCASCGKPICPALWKAEFIGCTRTYGHKGDHINTWTKPQYKRQFTEAEALSIKSNKDWTDYINERFPLPGDRKYIDPKAE